MTTEDKTELSAKLTELVEAIESADSTASDAAEAIEDASSKASEAAEAAENAAEELREAARNIDNIDTSFGGDVSDAATAARELLKYLEKFETKAHDNGYDAGFRDGWDALAKAVVEALHPDKREAALIETTKI